MIPVQKINKKKVFTDIVFRMITVCLISLLFLFLIKPCFADDHTTETKTPLDSVTLHLKWKHQFQFAGYYAALEKGFYRRVGLDVKIIEANTEKSTEQVLSGKADFGIAMSNLVKLRAKGKPVVALASIFQHSPLILLSLKDSGIENIHDLKGKKISFESHSEQLISYLKSEGLPKEKLDIYPHDYNIDKIISGEIDAMSAYSTDEPFMLLEKGIEYNTFSPRAGGIDFYGDTLFTSENQVIEHPERVSAFLKASLEGWKYALDNTDEIVDLILSKYSTRHSREHLLFEAQMSKRLIMANVVEIGYMNPGRWLHIVDSFQNMALIPNDFSLEGFLYERNPVRDLRWFYFSLIGVIVIAAMAFLLAGRFYQLNKSLKWEIKERQKNIIQLEEAQSQIKILGGIIPICMHCKGIRDDEGYWNQLEDYISEHSEVQFSHGICEKCLKKHYPEEVD